MHGLSQTGTHTSPREVLVSPAAPLAEPSGENRTVNGIAARPAACWCRRAAPDANSSAPSVSRMYSHGLTSDGALPNGDDAWPPAAAGSNCPTGPSSSRSVSEPASRSPAHLRDRSTPLGLSSSTASTCSWKLVEKSSLPSLPPVPSSGGKYGCSPVSTTAASIQGSRTSGQRLRNSWTMRRLIGDLLDCRLLSGLIHPAARAVAITWPAALIASRNAASLGVVRASRASSLRFGSLSLAPKPLPPFQGLSTGVGTYSLTSHPARSATVVSMTSPPSLQYAVAAGSACSPISRIRPSPAR